MNIILQWLFKAGIVYLLFCAGMTVWYLIQDGIKHKFRLNNCFAQWIFVSIITLIVSPFVPPILLFQKRSTGKKR